MNVLNTTLGADEVFHVKRKAYALNEDLKLKKQDSKQELGQEDFLKLLVSQLKMQDPLSPMSDKDFMAQIASFSSLKEMTLIREEMISLSKSMTFLNLGHLLGKKALFQDGESAVITGIRRTEHGPVLLTPSKEYSEKDLVELR